jgi:hypothetical protein
VASAKNQGVDTKSGDFFKDARRSGLWPDAQAIHRSAITKARNKLPWQLFEDIVPKAVDVAYELWPDSPEYGWHGMSVYAIDGSKYSLPATEQIREQFDPASGLQNPGKGHYPQCLVSTVYDVFRRLPIGRTVVGIHGSEREEAMKLMQFVPEGNVWLFDRGYPSYEFIKDLSEKFCGYFLFRCSAESSFPAVEEFLKKHRKEDTIWLAPSNKYLRKATAAQRKTLKLIKLRIIKLRSPDGTISVLLTNLFDREQFPRNEIIWLYFRRWEIETYYRDEKTVLEIEKFHGKTPNSIRQELFAVVVMSVISRTLMALCSKELSPEAPKPQFKNAIITLALDAAVLAPEQPEKAAQIFEELITEISRVKYYRSKKPRHSQPRVTKRAINKWSVGRQTKMAQP